ncbi:hypothetical protein PF008_g16107 [Phytophthora fragariae]|uniref:Uncharacterized protein n=1 Tax=Phytophthora fragariae TaxID=53985 RepID=A0A6G0RC59_9STRA|nr:hypothetical protein PF008_g16107 [Phytophthora fragariae]
MRNYYAEERGVAHTTFAGFRPIERHLLTWVDFEMETPPRGRKPQTPAAVKQVHARLKRQMESEMDVEGNPEMERMGDEAPVHAAAIKPLADDYDDDDLA